MITSRYSFFYKNLIITAFGLFFIAIMATPAQAFYTDVESTEANTFTAASFDILLTKTDITEDLGPGFTNEIEFSTVLLPVAGSLSAQYAVASEFIAGETDFCQAVNLIATHGAYNYNGPLLDFIAPTSTTMGTWELDLELDHTATNFPNNATCDVDVVFNAWRDGVALADSGYTDEERVQIRLTAQMLVLNEFLPNPDGEAYGFDFGSDSSDMPRGEWVELFNNSDIPFDITGWSIWDDSGSAIQRIYVTASNTAPATTIIPGRGWLVVYMNKAVLNNGGDTVQLLDGTDAVIDSYTYTTHDVCTLEPTPTATNTTNGITVGACDSVPGNKSYARIPDGIGAWVDPIPTPGAHNLLDDPLLDSASTTDGLFVFAQTSLPTTTATSALTTSTTTSVVTTDEATSTTETEATSSPVVMGIPDPSKDLTLSAGEIPSAIDTSITPSDGVNSPPKAGGAEKLIIPDSPPTDPGSQINVPAVKNETTVVINEPTPPVVLNIPPPPPDTPIESNEPAS